MKAQGRIIFLYLLLLNVGFCSPLILLFLAQEYGKLVSIFWGIAPIYFTFLFFMLMALSLHRKGIEVNYLFYSFIGPIELLRMYYNHFIKGRRITFLWGLFWLSFIIFVIRALYAFMS